MNRFRHPGRPALLVMAVFGLFSANTLGQEDSADEATQPLDQVRRISELSGRPIFAVAGQST